MKQRLLKILGLSLLMGAASPALSAFELTGTRALIAVTANGDRLPIGFVHFTPTGAGQATFRLNLTTEAFTDYFLSMREFKCLPGEKEVSCHVVYPYAHPGTVSLNNLAWLEHNLLFMYKAPSDFGAKLWNGVYYEFQQTGDTLTGTPKAVDLNDISAPPRNLTEPPYRKSQRHDINPEMRWIRQLVVE